MRGIAGSSDGSSAHRACRGRSQRGPAPESTRKGGTTETQAVSPRKSEVGIMTELILVGALLGFGLLFVLLLLYFVPVGLWITAVFSGVRVGLGTMIGMRLRKVPPGEIVRPLIS